jgi:hypothetical protein
MMDKEKTWMTIDQSAAIAERQEARKQARISELLFYLEEETGLDSSQIDDIRKAIAGEGRLGFSKYPLCIVCGGPMPYNHAAAWFTSESPERKPGYGGYHLCCEAPHNAGIRHRQDQGGE